MDGNTNGATMKWTMVPGSLVLTRSSAKMRCISNIGRFTIWICHVLCSLPLSIFESASSVEKNGTYALHLLSCPTSLLNIIFIFFSRLFVEKGDQDWVPLGCALWAAVLLAEHQTMVIMLIVKSRLTAGITSCTITILTLILASGNLR